MSQQHEEIDPQRIETTKALNKCHKCGGEILIKTLISDKKLKPKKNPIKISAICYACNIVFIATKRKLC